ncbi:acyl-CoA dehydrogenase [Pseudoroseicyclus aestuarii]|uniref:3-methylmercaptopropionyl-CoA dehydrogenase n=1 Tax=Pseudoroseicyclus aestuarii TaxID=1795041 RepID=A0A318SUG1_9RHOB|nr:acyl-CoA dehydrogenase [Pseudoroseicyclus aestuarii]PYE83886.1 hypothetical protein DFP88_103247 [Pseudoroseicyclus aestuarii]
MPYTAPLADFRFLLPRLGLPEIAATERFAEATPETAEAILTEAARLCESVLAPLQRPGDLEPARLENGVVRTPPGFGEGWSAIAEGGWIGMAASPEQGGMGLPMLLTTAVNEMMAGACLSLQLAPLMSQGQIEALEHHADADLKAQVLPRLISGDWSGTMNLTEPQAGSDVGALRTRAEPLEDGRYAITGQKIYITWGDNDFTENVCHLVLARLPDAPQGSKGISLFLVPKYIPQEDGSPGEANSLRVVSLEHKLGMHGSPTAVMAYEGATGWIVGAPNGGMAAMFTMMNNARLGVGTQGVGVAEAACTMALAHATERKQGRTAKGGAIIEHDEVRRMLAEMRADTFAARAITLACGAALDMGRATGSEAWTARAGLLTPIAKAFGTEVGARVADLSIQVHGGMGYVEETGVAQLWRDVRVTSIYEGTNGIQALDLVGRKMADGGDAAKALIAEVAAGAEAARQLLPDLAEPVLRSAQLIQAATEALLGRDMAHRQACAVPYLRAFARVLGGHYHLMAAQGGEAGRTRLAGFYIHRMLPEAAAHLTAMGAGMEDLTDLTAEDLAS